MTDASEKLLLVNQDQALQGRDSPMSLENTHHVSGKPIIGPFTEIEGDCEQIILGLGCFWGAERVFWQLDGVYSTSVGYAGGYTPNPTYEEVCSGQTAHSEVVLVVYQPSKISLEAILKVFFESHDPTQGARQGNDIGTQYRSAIYAFDKNQLVRISSILSAYQTELTRSGVGSITTEVKTIDVYYYAEQYHQQYLAKNPAGYCGIKGTGVACPI